VKRARISYEIFAVGEWGSGGVGDKNSFSFPHTGIGKMEMRGNTPLINKNILPP
jgi:hypothetical protein